MSKIWRRNCLLVTYNDPYFLIVKKYIFLLHIQIYYFDVVYLIVFLYVKL